MSAPRQQRAKQSRRAIPNAQNPTPLPLAFVLAGNNATQLSLYLSAPRSQIVQKGIPAIRAVSLDQLPTAIALLDSGVPATPTLMNLTYAGPIPSYEQFQVPAYDTAIRTSFGGYLPAAVIDIAPPDPGVFPWTVTADGSGIMVLTMGMSVTSCTLPVVGSIHGPGGAFGISAARITESSFNVTMSGNISPGDSITWTPATNDCISQSAQQPQPDTVIAG